MSQTQHLAELIEQLAETDPNDKQRSQFLSQQIRAIAGSWYLIGRAEDSLYIDAMKFDNDGTLLKKIIKAYIACRINYVQKIRKGDRTVCLTDMNDRYFILSQLIGKCGEFATLALIEIKEMLNSNDTEIEGVGCEALKGIGLNAIEAVPEMFDLMQKRGINERPYKIGEILVQLSKEFPEILTFLKIYLSSDIENLVQSSLFTCYLMDQKSAFLYEELMNIAKSRTGETKSMAILALGSTGKKDDDLSELLLENATNPEYYIRGNSINSLGRLKLSPERALPIIIAALEDTEGYDWTVQDCAIKAIGNYDNFPANYVISATSILKVIRKKLKDEQEQGWITQIKEVNQALKKLRNNCQ